MWSSRVNKNATTQVMYIA
jgi:hypothetical protein